MSAQQQQQQQKLTEEQSKKNLAQLGALEEDDEFEEFAAEGNIDGVFHKIKGRAFVFTKAME